MRDRAPGLRKLARITLPLAVAVFVVSFFTRSRLPDKSMILGPLLQDLVEHTLMECFPLHRGE